MKPPQFYLCLSIATLRNQTTEFHFLFCLFFRATVANFIQWDGGFVVCYAYLLHSTSTDGRKTITMMVLYLILGKQATMQCRDRWSDDKQAAHHHPPVTIHKRQLSHSSRHACQPACLREAGRPRPGVLAPQRGGGPPSRPWFRPCARDIMFLSARPRPSVRREPQHDAAPKVVEQ